MDYQNIRKQLVAEYNRLTAVKEHLLAFGRLDTNDQAQLDHIEAKLQTIRRALRRIDSGTYEICEVCGQSIGIARLEAANDCCRCIACESRINARISTAGRGIRAYRPAFVSESQASW